jgi:hypothetical protein
MVPFARNRVQPFVYELSPSSQLRAADSVNGFLTMTGLTFC